MSTASPHIQHCTDAPPPPRPPDTIFMDVVVDTRRLSFEFEPGGRAPAVVVGSLRSADISINDARVALVEFHFERVGRAIFVVPAYGANVTIDSVPLKRPQALAETGSIAFAGHVLHVEIASRPDPSNCTTLVHRPSFFQPLRTHSETPFAKGSKRRTLTSRTTSLELPELLATEPGATRWAMGMPARLYPLLILSAALSGWLLGHVTTQWASKLWAWATQ